jgi:glutamyl-tRNA synthetase
MPYAIRCALGDEAASVSVMVPGGHELLVDLKADMGDFIIWRKDDMAAYQLASICDDEEIGTTLIVRGMDLMSSTAAQLWLANALDLEIFPKVRFIHHPLLYDDSQHKLSKSEGAMSVLYMRNNGLAISSLLKEFCLWAGLPEVGVNSLDEMQILFNKENDARKLY